ncbi:MAG: penicillin-binding protein [Myxococcota bacterium]|nr:penicillin-binding protein [Myxococcota bacterium]
MSRAPAKPPENSVQDAGLVLDRARYRSTLVTALVGLGLMVLSVRATPLMLMEDSRLEAQAALQFQRSVEVEAPRGDILARDGSVLATTVMMPSVHADPKMLDPEDVEPLARALAPLLDKDAGNLIKRLSQHSRRDVLLANEVPPDRLEAIEALDPGRVLFTRSQPTRYYPSRESAVQILGVVGYNGRGVEGVERQLDPYLRGSTFRYIEERDADGRVISTEYEARSRAKAGGQVTLTLDPVIQRAAEEALDQVVEASEPLSATAVVLDVQTGEILALANRPHTNPNDRRGRDISHLRNHGIADAHEPGSIMKPFVIALALEEGLYTPDTLVDCEGGAHRFGRSRKPIRDDHPHDVVTVSEVLKYSSNIGTAKMAFSLGAERTIEGLQRFGFQSRTGVDLPGETRGFIRSPDKIKPIELATTAFGQGMQASALQVASALQALANDGVRMQPYIVAEVRDRYGQIKLRNKPEGIGRPVSEKVARQTIQMMSTVLEEGGTGTRARVPGYTAAGKTGTGQKVVDGRYSPTARVASFMGVAPANDPRLAIVVMVDTPSKGSRYGGTVAGPAFSLIAQRSLRYLGVPEDRVEEDEALQADSPDDPTPQDLPPLVVAELAWTPEGTLRVPDLAGLSMRDALAALDGSGLELSVQGSGRVIDQRPGAGSDLHTGQRIELVFD